MAIRIATPGVYIQEKNAFGSSIVASPTAIPAFVGYTEKADKNGKPLQNVPTVIDSLDAFEKFYGRAWVPTYGITETSEGESDLKVGEKKYELFTAEERYFLYDSLRLFFTNGGGKAYIVSVGTYGDEIDSDKIIRGIRTLNTATEPTLLACPDAVALSAQACAGVQQEMLQHCESSDNRFAVLDVQDGLSARSYDEEDAIDNFRNNLGKVGLKHGAAYYPWLNASVVSDKEFSYVHFDSAEQLVQILTEEAELMYDNDRKKQEAVAEIQKLNEASGYDADLHQTLKSISPAYKSLMTGLANKLNVLPPSGAIVGAYARIDAVEGIWKAPANEGLAGVASPYVSLTNEDQEDLNLTVGGKSVNAIRAFAGEGTIIWGARTLDGNSQDWRYINVRRTMSFIENSVKGSVKSYVFQPNTPMTWVAVKGAIDAFLTTLWNQGALVGTSQNDAFVVDVGLGSTMTQTDILDGMMKISVKVAISRPAEFIVLTFQQQMQS
ncbi:phage tail sheath subtilisin-like domain-containing protein [Flammeovirga yaeyamensis]|uniref:Phage tail sheath subtilisin-like domain-containing protein n=1 Tax=Flammeovirga yaeyamensis TaxID=367791 RepID=A0AAX1NAE2_9BACT|nr:MULTISPECIES: phage tail sheath C-terminal domain-containing protein [Flammeovirga]ANQ52276.1 phage tail sheath family protein [Flammeovirga sp. MY04]MBB3701409.1 hypothetical protein [Flammeovirga yaeyamensis]NMF38633.1 phage tail sheath family protein [Flammeovirga yaeyamensis]QWG04513.1 phage tail sheath subtilisin-like domain-containing protein [Flammeovirga yaeyamensis]